MEKKFWRCHVCNDIHYGNFGPEICPTCAAKNAFVQINSKESAILQKMTGADGVFDEAKMREAWKEFCDKNEFQLNPDKNHVEILVNGLFVNENKYGLKLCPCKARPNLGDKMFEIICPCNFKTHESWSSKGMCWCGLFVKK